MRAGSARVQFGGGRLERVDGGGIRKNKNDRRGCQKINHSLSIKIFKSAFRCSVIQMYTAALAAHSRLQLVTSRSIAANLTISNISNALLDRNSS